MTSGAVEQFVHDARGSLGSIRLSIGALLEEDDDPAFREVLLRGVEAEVVRLGACLDALPVTLIEPAGAITEVDVARRLRAAVQRTESRGVVVEVFAPDAVQLPTTIAGEAVERVLAAALGLAAGARPKIVVRLDRAAHEIVIGGGERWPMAEHLLARLAALLNATLHSSATELTLRWHDG